MRENDPDHKRFKLRILGQRVKGRLGRLAAQYPVLVATTLVAAIAALALVGVVVTLRKQGRDEHNQKTLIQHQKTLIQQVDGLAKTNAQILTQVRNYLARANPAGRQRIRIECGQINQLKTTISTIQTASIKSQKTLQAKGQAPSYSPEEQKLINEEQKQLIKALKPTDCGALAGTGPDFPQKLTPRGTAIPPVLPPPAKAKS